MIFKHKRSGILYRKIMESFSTERQRPSVIYMALETGQVFDRDAEAFKENFRYTNNAQESIEPKDKAPELLLDNNVVTFKEGDVVDWNGTKFKCESDGAFRILEEQP